MDDIYQGWRVGALIHCHKVIISPSFLRCRQPGKNVPWFQKGCANTGTQPPRLDLVEPDKFADKFLAKS